MAAAAEARATLRRLLRAIDRHVTAVAGNTQWRDHALSEFRRTGGSADAAAAQQGLQLARDYAGLIESVAHHRVRAARRRARSRQHAAPACCQRPLPRRLRWFSAAEFFA